MSKFTTALSRFHGDETGNESLQTVAILAVGAIVLIGLIGVWNNKVKPGAEKLVDDLYKTKG